MFLTRKPRAEVQGRGEGVGVGLRGGLVAIQTRGRNEWRRAVGESH